MPKLSRKGWLVIATIAIAIVEVAVGELISRTVALWLLFVFIPLLGLAFYKVSRTREDITSSDVREFRHRVERRKDYLPQLRQALQALLDKQYELTNTAGRLSLEEYRDKFLKLSSKYKVIRIMTSGLVGKLVRKFVMKDEKEIILMALRQENFIRNNLYIRGLEQKEDYQKLWREYNKWYSRTPEKSLRNLVAHLVKREKELSSVSSMAQVSRREITKSPRILAWLYRLEAVSQNLVEIQRKMVNDEFKELLEDGKSD
jgi:hypothetical protein